jgi:hypothetical protein
VAANYKALLRIEPAESEQQIVGYQICVTPRDIEPFGAGMAHVQIHQRKHKLWH